MLTHKMHYMPLIATFTVISLFPVKGMTDTETNQTQQRIPLEDVQRFSNALSEIKRYYVKPVSDKELFDNAIRGMLSGLDPHSSYLNEDDYKELQTSTTGEFGGLGIEVTMEEGIVKVVTPLVDTPAYNAGIKPGDYIAKLGTKSVQGLTLKDAVNLMRGTPGSKIELTVLRKGQVKPLTFLLTREKIQIKSVKSELLDNTYGYVQLTQFQAQTYSDMVAAINKLVKNSAGHKLKGMILDLRNNPGGLLDSAIQVSDAFLDQNNAGKQEMIVYTQGRLPGSKFTAMAHPGDIIDHAPMVVLINNGSASAAEIVAGALKDNARAIILGTRSFGKGSVQTVLPLDNSRAIKLTTALYYTPSGTSIQAKGISPDIVVDAIDIPKIASTKNTFLNLAESDLSGHLVNSNTTDNSKNKDIASNDEKLLHKDYQLYAALNILKGLAVATKQ